MWFSDQEYVSSLPLQAALYFNLFYFPFWITSEVVMLVAKVSNVTDDKLCYILFHLPATGNQSPGILYQQWAINGLLAPKPNHNPIP